MFLMLRHWNLLDQPATLLALNNKNWVDKDVRCNDGKAKVESLYVYMKELNDILAFWAAVRSKDD